jgi:hypothetical protein
MGGATLLLAHLFGAGGLARHSSGRCGAGPRPLPRAAHSSVRVEQRREATPDELPSAASIGTSSTGGEKKSIDMWDPLSSDSKDKTDISIARSHMSGPLTVET